VLSGSTHLPPYCRLSYQDVINVCSPTLSCWLLLTLLLTHTLTLANSPTTHTHTHSHTLTLTNSLAHSLSTVHLNMWEYLQLMNKTLRIGANRRAEVTEQLSKTFEGVHQFLVSPRVCHAISKVCIYCNIYTA